MQGMQPDEKGPAGIQTPAVVVPKSVHVTRDVFSVSEMLFSIFVRRFAIADHVFMAICIENIFSVSGQVGVRLVLWMLVCTEAICPCSSDCI